MAKAKFKVGEFVSITHYAQIDEIDAKTGKLTLHNVNTGLKFSAAGDNLLESMSSANHFTKTEKVTRTELAEKLIESKGLPLTVKWEKEDGSKRTLIGILLSHENLMGRGYMHDFEIGDVKSGIRLVDFRTLEELTVNNVKFILK